MIAPIDGHVRSGNTSRHDALVHAMVQQQDRSTAPAHERHAAAIDGVGLEIERPVRETGTTVDDEELAATEIERRVGDDESGAVDEIERGVAVGKPADETDALETDGAANGRTVGDEKLVATEIDGRVEHGPKAGAVERRSEVNRTTTVADDGVVEIEKAEIAISPVADGRNDVKDGVG